MERIYEVVYAEKTLRYDTLLLHLGSGESVLVKPHQCGASEYGWDLEISYALYKQARDRIIDRKYPDHPNVGARLHPTH